jgi:chitin disaccharide deacetylase
MGKTSSTRRVIVNADDFGFSHGITEGILRAHRDGIVTSTTIAANMPAAEEAVRRLAEVPDLGIGVHLNISQGPPLSQEAKRLAAMDGQMHLTATQAVLLCVRKPWLARVIEAEYDAQIRWVLDHGLRPTHLDSHRHTHGFPPVFARVARLARRYNIRFVRWHREPLLSSSPVRANQPGLTRALNVLGWINARIAPGLIATKGTWGVAYTGSIDATWLKWVARVLPAGVTEIMTHPGLAGGLDAAASRLREAREQELVALCDPAVREVFKQQEVERVHYGQL